MKAFALLLGLLFGLSIAFSQGVLQLIVPIVLSGFVFWWARQRRLFLYYCIAISSSLLLGLALRFIPLPQGQADLVGVVEKAGDNYIVLRTFIHRYYVSIQSHSYQAGDWVKVTGKFQELRFTEYESRFSFGEYLNGLGVYQEIASPKTKGLFLFPWRIRDYEQRFLSSFSERGKALLAAMLFGQKDYQNDLVSIASELSLLSLLSGMGIFYSFALSLLDKFFQKFFPNYADVIVLFLAMIPLPFCLKRIGVIRAFSMRVLKVLDEQFIHKSWDYLTRLSFVGIALLWKPYRVLDTGYLASFGIAFSLYIHRFYLRSKNKIWNKVKVMGFIQLFLLPFSLAQGKVHVFSFLFVLLFYPLFLLLMGLSWLSFLTVPFTGLFNGVADWLFSVFSALKAVDIKMPLPCLSVLVIGFFYVVFFLTLYLRQAQYFRVRNALIVGAIGVYLLTLIPVVPALTKSVSFINVGQGDCALIQDGLRTVMIDTGGVKNFDMAEESLIPYLRKRRIYKIDALIASHQDFDHVGAVSSLIQNFHVGRYVTSPTAFPLTVGSMRLENHNVYDATDENDKSLVLSLSFMGKKWLFTGDAPVWIEKRIVADNPGLDIDVLKVGHHGSDTSTCEEFLDAITPETAVISCGYKNRYGHPTSAVLSRLKRRGITIRRTDLEGTITFTAPIWA